MSIQSLFLFFIVFFQGARCATENNKIIFCTSTPRSISTAFTRMIQARQDFAIFHEPSFYPAYIGDFGEDENFKKAFKENIPTALEEVRDLIFEASEKSNVFIKEMGFAMNSFLKNQFDVVHNPNVYFLFLVRDPHQTIISLYKQYPHVDQFNYFLGYKAVYEVYQHAANHAVHKPLIIEVQNLCNDPEKEVRTFCNHVGIEFKENALHWENKENNFPDELWHEVKQPFITKVWHKEALSSTRFTKLHEYERDAEGQPTFAEIENEEDRKACKRVYQENVVYYKMLLNARSLPTQGVCHE